MASKQALDGKYNIWVRSADLVANDPEPLFANSVLTANFKFPELPDAKLYILKLEQYALTGAPSGYFYVTEPPGGVQDFAPTALVSVEGFSQLPGDMGLQGKDVRATNGLLLSRFSTNTAVSNLRDTGTPDQTPTHLVTKPTDGTYTVKILGQDLTPLFLTNPAGTEVAIEEWILCLSLQPVPDQEADRYFGR